MIYHCLLFQFLVAILIGAQYGCEHPIESKNVHKHIYLLGSDTIILFLNSSFQEVDCGRYQHDDAHCKGYESDNYIIFCNYYQLPDPLIYKVKSDTQSLLNAEEQISMMEKIRASRPKSSIDIPKHIKSSNGFEGISINYKDVGKNHLQFRGYHLQQKLMLSLYLDSKTPEANLEEALISFLQNLYVQGRDSSFY